MTTHTSTSEPFHRRSDYVTAVIELYLSLPDTPQKPRPDDRYFAQTLCHRSVPLLVIEAALLLASARRIFRDPTDPLPPVRSLRYFVHAIAEIQDELRLRMDYESLLAYSNYLRQKVPLSSPPLQRKRTRTPPSPTPQPLQLRFKW